MRVSPVERRKQRSVLTFNIMLLEICIVWEINPIIEISRELADAWFFMLILQCDGGRFDYLIGASVFKLQ